jgi:homoserine kinase
VNAVRVKGISGIQLMIFVPDEHRAGTAQSRAALPESVPLTDASFNIGRTALLIGALTGAPQHLFEATEDRLHQAYRAPGTPETAKLVAALREMGLAAVVSGSGPSVLVLAPGDQDLASQAQRACPDKWRATRMAIATEGAVLLRG